MNNDRTYQLILDMKNKLTTVLYLALAILSMPSAYADKKYKVVSDEAELRKITDNYRSDPNRPKDFIPQGNGTVIDKRTGLQWMRCSLGQEWTGETCTYRGDRPMWTEIKSKIYFCRI